LLYGSVVMTVVSGILYLKVLTSPPPLS
jgi:hypothetical protein